MYISEGLVKELAVELAVFLKNKSPQEVWKVFRECERIHEDRGATIDLSDVEDRLGLPAGFFARIIKTVPATANSRNGAKCNTLTTEL